MPSFSAYAVKLLRCANSHRVGRRTVDIVFLVATGSFVILTFALVTGCAALERKR
jgi:hypothetical protein